MNIKSTLLLLAALPALCSAEVVTLRLYEGRSPQDATPAVAFQSEMLISADRPTRAQSTSETTYLKSADFDPATKSIILTPGVVEHGTRAEVEADSKIASLYHISLSHKTLVALRTFTIAGSDQRLQTPSLHENSMIQHAMLVSGKETDIGAFDVDLDTETPTLTGTSRRSYFRITATLSNPDANPVAMAK